jgi:hypothetical protein
MDPLATAVVDLVGTYLRKPREEAAMPVSCSYSESSLAG